MKNWIELSSVEYREVWDRIYDKFNFKPSVSNFPSFEVPSPFITYDTSLYSNGSVDIDTYNEIYSEFEEKSLLVFQERIQKNEYLYALDWQHPCYWINPHLEFLKNEFDEWTVPIFPDGDYYFFIHKNFEWGLLGHPWEKTITIFGIELIKGFEEHQPRMLQKILPQG